MITIDLVVIDNFLDC